MRFRRVALKKQLATGSICAIALIFGVVGIVRQFDSHAATPTASFEAEAGTRSGTAALVSDTTASGGSAVRFQALTSPGTKIAIIGDSLTYQDAGGQGAVSAAFEAAGWPQGATWFYGVVGKAINDADSTGKTTVQNIATARSAIGEPDVWVIALGTNDALNFASDTKIKADIQTVLTALGPNAKVLWVNTAGNPGDNFSTLNATVNADIASAVSARPHTLLADWSGYILPISQPNYWVDRVHMSDTGYALRNQFVANKSIQTESL